MTETIGNPLSYAAQGIARVGRHAADSADAFGAHMNPADLTVRKLNGSDIQDVLRAGWEDFQAARSDVILLCLLYPVMGLILTGIAFHQSLIPLLFPLTSGFALLGPAAAVGLYEISRRREAGEAVNWASAFSVIGAPQFMAILGLTFYLAALFFVWLAVAYGIYAATLGPAMPVSAAAFLNDALTTGAGWTMIVLGSTAGAVFALMALAISLVSFPLLLDRPVGLVGAVTTSVRVVRANPRIALTWGLVVAFGLALGALPLLIGLVIVLPVLGHATWHFYRRAIG